MPATSWSAGTSLSRKPLAPGAQRVVDVLVEVEGGEHQHARRRSPAAAIRRVASMPSISGIRMSISTTSGSSSRDAVDACSAVGALADDLDVVLGLEDHAEAGADQRLVVDEQHADAHAGTDAPSGQPGAHGEAAAGARARPASDAAVAAPTRSRMPDEAVAAAASPSRAGAGAAVVDDLELDRVVGS